MSALAGIGTPLLVIALGCVVLLWGADEFMEHLPPLAAWAGVPVYAVSLLLAGAEPEEFTTAVLASAGDRPVLAVGDAVGSNITIVALGLGAAMALAPVALDARLRRFALVASAAGALSTLALLDGVVAAWEGALLVGAALASVVLLWRIDRLATAREDAYRRSPASPAESAERAAPTESRGTDGPGPEGLPGLAGLGSPEAAPLPTGLRRDLPRTVGGVALGLLAMVVGGALAVDGATRLADASGWSHRATGLIVLALATSVEVFAIVFAARRRGLARLAVAALLGSVVFNATMTLGAAALVAPLDAPGLWPAAALATLLPLTLLLMRGRRVTRAVGAGLVGVYVAFAVAVLGRWL